MWPAIDRAAESWYQKPEDSTWPWAAVDNCCWHSQVEDWGGKKLVDSIRPLTTLITGFLASSCCNPCHATLTEASGQLGNALETNKRDLACYRLGSCWSEEKVVSWNENCIGLKSFIERAYFAGGSPAVREPHLCHSISALQTWFLKNSNSDPSWSFPGFSSTIECQTKYSALFFHGIKPALVIQSI